ncbi:MAG: hypothetical protein H7Y38_06750, partial [Armatimonadetes bacterium]|nr:hypothetical protein [Armatimonadota bacterium]
MLPSLSPVITEIAAGWQFAQRLPAHRDMFQTEGGEKTWLPAVVPGHVHTDLVRAGVIATPAYRLGELGTAWVEDADWTYRTTFAVSSERIASRGTHGRHFLSFGGLDTFARVFLNDALIATTE